MTLRDRLIGGVVDGLMIAIDTIASFWQTPREVEWAKAAAASGELCDCGHRIHDSNVCPVGECLCIGRFPDRAKAHAAADRLAEREAEEEVAEPKCGPNGPQCDDKWCMYCVPMVAPKTSAPTPGAVDGPAEGDAPRPPSAVVGSNVLGALPWSFEDGADDWWLKGAFPGLVLDAWGVVIGRFDTVTQAEFVAAAVNSSAAVDPPASVPAAECSAPEFDWVTTAIPVIAGVLAEHVPSPQCNYILCLNGQLETCGEFRDWQGWRNHVAPHIAVDIQSDCLTTTYDFPSGDRPRPLADFPKHQ